MSEKTYGPDPELAKKATKYRGKHLFQPGKSGNPAGRKKGVESLAYKLQRELTRDCFSEVKSKLMEFLHAGDRKILLFLAEKMLPAQPLPPSFDINGTLLEQLKQLRKLLQNGEITSSDFITHSDAISMQSNLEFNDQIKPEIENLKSSK